jgi:hypothetical protein
LAEVDVRIVEYDARHGCRVINGRFLIDPVFLARIGATVREVPDTLASTIVDSPSRS